MHRLRYLDKRESHYVHMYISVARDRGNLTGDTFCAQPSRVTGRINHPLYFPPDAPRKLKPLRVPGSGGVIHLENPSSSARQFPPYLLPVIFNIALLLPCTGASRYEISHVETNLSYISPLLSLSLSLWYHLLAGIFTFSGTLPWPTEEGEWKPWRSSEQRPPKRATEATSIGQSDGQTLSRTVPDWMAAGIDRYRSFNGRSIFERWWIERFTSREGWKRMKAAADIGGRRSHRFSHRGVHTNRDEKKGGERGRGRGRVRSYN